MVVNVTQERPGLGLQELEDVLPEHWREFSPNPRRDHEERVQRQLASFITIDDRVFAGFRSVPRYFHPQASSEALVLSLEVIWWYFAFDDPFDDDEVGARAGELIERMQSVLATGTLPEHPSDCEQLAARFRGRAKAMDRSGAVWPRFIQGCLDWVGSVQPINRHSSSVVPTVEQYLELRLQNVGILPEYTLNELVHRLNLVESFRCAPEVKRFADLSAMVIALFNDVYSYEREARMKTQWNSLELRVLAGASLPEAYKAQVAHAREMVAEMEVLGERLVEQGLVGGSLFGGSDPIPKHLRDNTRYIRGIVDVVVGHVLWVHDGGRYVSPSSPFRELRGGALRRRVKQAS